jgi:hypothetical protein
MPDPREPCQTTPPASSTGNARDLTGPGVERRRTSGEDEKCRYTLHLDFTADNPMRARETALVLAEGLGILRDDVDTHSALLSAAHRWALAETVFCLAAGPEGAVCADITGHPGWHTEVETNGLRWGDG